jgi:antibiotic biosynthesis monooxygenase (ABM) superfamily enzyme
MRQLERLGRGTRPVARRRLVRLVTTLASWAVAYAVVLALLAVLGRQLAALPVALRALVISAAMIAVMVNLVMPALNRIITGWLADPNRPQGHPGKPASQQVRADE